MLNDVFDILDDDGRSFELSYLILRDSELREFENFFSVFLEMRKGRGYGAL